MSDELLYHLTTPESWAAAHEAGCYEGNSLASEGFIHCSTERQLLEVANRLFAGRDDLIVLVIDPSRVQVEIRWENLEGGSERYPHLYGPLPAAAVTRTRALALRGDGRLDWDRRN